MRMRSRLSALLVAVSLAWAEPADAKKTETLPYAFADVWPSAVRFLRVDEGFTLVEKDESTGYVLFRFTPPGTKKEAQGSLEVIRHGGKTEVLVALPSMPAHHEQVLLDRLVQKITHELGEPAPAPRDPGAKRKTPVPDAGTESVP